MTITKRNGKYYCRFQLNGERHHFLCKGARDLGEARQAEAMYMVKIDKQQNGVMPREKKDVTMRVLYNLFDNYSKVNKKSYSRDIYFIKVLKRSFSENQNAKFKMSDFENFKIKLLEDGKSVATVNKYLGILSKMYNLAVAEGLLDKNPLSDVKKFNEKNYKIRYLTKDEEIRLFSAVDKYFPYLKPIIICALQTGMRKSEILNLRWDNIDFGFGFIELLETKSGKSRKIPISKTLTKVLQEIPRTSEYVFVNEATGLPYRDIHKSFATLLDKAKIKKFRFHDLRHTVATRLVEKGVPLPVVQEILGHAKISTTMRYTHVVASQKLEAIDVLDKYCA